MKLVGRLYSVTKQYYIKLVIEVQLHGERERSFVRSQFMLLTFTLSYFI